MNEPRWPIDTTAGRVVMVSALLLVGTGGWIIKTNNSLPGYLLVAAGMLLATAFRALFFRGFFGENPTGDEPE